MADDWIQKLIAYINQDADDRIAFMTVAGTGAFNPSAGAANFPAQIAALLDPDKFRWVPIVYPASFPFTWSVDAGVRNLTGAIKGHTGQFCGACFSQGAMVWSQVRNLLTGGALSSREDDWLGTVVMGNPCRKTNDTLSGLTVTSGHHGIASAAKRLSTTNDKWWEMVIPSDLAADIADDLTGQWLSTLFMAAWGSVNPTAAVVKTLAASPVNLKSFVPEVMSYFGLGFGVSGGAAHTQYDTYVPATFDGDSNAKTMVQLAADQINSLAD